MCKKCGNTGYIITLYKDGHEDVDLCDCEYNPYTQIKELKEEVQIFRKANDEKNDFLQQLGISSGGEFNRVRYYIDKLVEENRVLKSQLNLYEIGLSEDANYV